MPKLSRSPLFLLAFTPLTLFAQVDAGDQTGVLYTTVGEELHPFYGPMPLFSQDTVSIDLDSDGVRDLHFTCGNINTVDHRGASCGVQMRHAGLAVAMEAAIGYAAERFDSGEPIGAGLPWRSFEADPSAPIAGHAYTMGNLSISGDNEWMENGAVATPGFLGVRITEEDGTRYGWIGMVSYVSLDSAWLQIIDIGIQDGVTRMDEVHERDAITARVTPYGNVLLQGPLEGVQRITLHDASGRMLRQVNGPAPYAVHLSGEARGVYVLQFHDRAGIRSLKVVW